MAYAGVRIFSADIQALKAWAGRTPTMEAVGRAIDLSRSVGSDVARRPVARQTTPGQTKTVNIYFDDHAALVRFADRHDLSIVDAIARLIELALAASTEDIARVIRKRAARRANLEVNELREASDEHVGAGAA